MEAKASVALGMALVPLQKFPIDFENFWWKRPFQNENGLALSKMKFQGWNCIFFAVIFLSIPAKCLSFVRKKLTSIVWNPTWLPSSSDVTCKSTYNGCVVPRVTITQGGMTGVRIKGGLGGVGGASEIKMGGEINLICLMKILFCMEKRNNGMILNHKQNEKCDTEAYVECVTGIKHTCICLDQMNKNTCVQHKQQNYSYKMKHRLQISNLKWPTYKITKRALRRESLPTKVSQEFCCDCCLMV